LCCRTFGAAIDADSAPVFLVIMKSCFENNSINFEHVNEAKRSPKQRWRRTIVKNRQAHQSMPYLRCCENGKLIKRQGDKVCMVDGVFVES
jgi:hypothetical protein